MHTSLGPEFSDPPLLISEMEHMHALAKCAKGHVHGRLGVMLQGPFFGGVGVGGDRISCFRPP